jgi:hypothetical protein
MRHRPGAVPDRVDWASMDVGRGPETAPFAHASEAELARILDYYGISWEYEPRSFPILWNLDGAVVESFAPDFYLPELDLYLELTTLRQSLVRKKNRKLRRLRELYPDVQIKLFYARDFRALMLKYGRIGLVDSLTGTEGQATPPRRPTPDDETAGKMPGQPAAAPAREPTSEIEPHPGPQRRRRQGRRTRGGQAGPVQSVRPQSSRA